MLFAESPPEAKTYAIWLEYSNSGDTEVRGRDINLQYLQKALNLAPLDRISQSGDSGGNGDIFPYTNKQQIK